MKKLVSFIIALVALGSNVAFAQCNTATVTTTPYGDDTPCKNSQGNYYYLPQPPNSQGSCNVDYYKWFGPQGSIITDGVLTASGSTGLTTDSAKVWINFKTKNGAVQVIPYNSCNQPGVSVGLNVTLSCSNIASSTPQFVPQTYLPDTAMTIGTPFCNQYYMSLPFTTLGIVAGYQLYVKASQYYPNGTCYNGEYWRPVGTGNTSPIYVQWGWTPMIYNQTYNCRFRMGTTTGQVIWSDEFVLTTTLTP